MEIIKNLKTHYRGLLVTYILKAIEDNLVTPSTCAIDISSKINILQAIQFVTDSWRKVSSVTIQHCFTHCGLMMMMTMTFSPSKLGTTREAEKCIDQLRLHFMQNETPNTPTCHEQMIKIRNRI